MAVFAEERSMAPVIEHMLRAPGHDAAAVVAVPRDGTGGLRRSLPTRLRAWRDPQARFLMACDGDSVDCRCMVDGKKRKNGFVEIASSAGLLSAAGRVVFQLAAWVNFRLSLTGRGCSAIARIAGQKLEAWFLGDGRLRAKPKFRASPGIHRRYAVIRTKSQSRRRSWMQWLERHRKTGSAREAAPRMDRGRNTSRSFRRAMNALKQPMDGQELRQESSAKKNSGACARPPRACLLFRGLEIEASPLNHVRGLHRVIA